MKLLGTYARAQAVPDASIAPTLIFASCEITAMLSSKKKHLRKCTLRGLQPHYDMYHFQALAMNHMRFNLRASIGQKILPEQDWETVRDHWAFMLR